jgi:hypothetical protein
MILVGCDPDKKKEKEADKTPPIISFSDNDTILLDLGDKTTALMGVKANDDVDGDITSSLKLLTEIETVGYLKLEYEVSDAAKNKRTAERHAIVKSEKLVGNYEAVLFEETSSPMIFNYTVASQNVTELFIQRFHGISNCQVTCVPDGAGRLKMTAEGDFYEGVIEMKKFTAVNGEIIFEDVNGNYSIVSMKYELVPQAGNSEYKYNATCVRK